MRTIPIRKIFWSEIGSKKSMNHFQKVWYFAKYKVRTKYPFKMSNGGYIK